MDLDYLAARQYRNSILAAQAWIARLMCDAVATGKEAWVIELRQAIHALGHAYDTLTTLWPVERPEEAPDGPPPPERGPWRRAEIGAQAPAEGGQRGHLAAVPRD